MNREKPLLELKHIGMTFYKKQGGLQKQQAIEVLSDISMCVYPGEVVALVGESGGGKTTIGNIITGLIEPTSGELLYEGIDKKKMTRAQYKAYRRGVQIVQQDSYAALNPARTIYQSLEAPLIKNKIVANKKAAEQEIIRLLGLVELKPVEQFLYKYPHQLSGGQRQRILLARAISLQPKIIVADEPVSMIDVSLRVSVLNLMSKLNRELKIAFVYITHDLATARYISKNGYMGVLYLGKLVEMGPVQEVISNPKHPYLQALLTAVPIPNPQIARNRGELQLKDVEMPSIINPPTGCRFHTRCIYATEACKEKVPVMREYEKRMMSCDRAEQIPKFELK